MSEPDSIPASLPAQTKSPRQGHTTGEVPGQRYGDWTLLYRGENCPKRRARWWCQCKCGTLKLIYLANLRHGYSRKCKRCGRVDNGHGGTYTPEYSVWRGMIGRCTNPNSESWVNYGGRGIGVCERWAKFQNFLDDMGKRPAGHSIDRINNNGNYEPGNCRWATSFQQARNTRSNRLITIGSVTMCATEWAETTGIGRSKFLSRLSNGWTPQEALEFVVRKRTHRRTG